MIYNEKAFDTMYKGVHYRSRLEAKWAALFEQLGWRYQYEPIDGGTWSPDFLLYAGGPMLVEVKPFTAWEDQTAWKMETSIQPGLKLLVGIAPGGQGHIGWISGWSRPTLWDDAVVSDGAIVPRSLLRGMPTDIEAAWRKGCNDVQWMPR